MKKHLTLILLLLLIIFPLISAIEFDIKSEFQKGETLSARVSGNFVSPVTENNIFFYRNHVRIPIEFDISLIEEEFYIYAVLPNNPGNYSIEIQDARYMKGSEEIKDTIRREFKIIDEQAPFSISPGFVYTSDDFEISTQNLLDEKIDISVSTTTSVGPSGGFFSSLFGSVEESESNSVEVKSGEVKKIDFDVKGVTDSTLKTISLSSNGLTYEIPVYVFKNSTGIVQTPKSEYEFSDKELTVNMATNNSKTYIFYLENFGETTIENITFSLSGNLKNYISLSTDSIDSLFPEEKYKLELHVTSKTEDQSIQGQLSAKDSKDTYAYSAIFLNFKRGYIPSENGTNNQGNDNNTGGGEYCILCDSEEGELCEGITDNKGCCSEACTIKKNSANEDKNTSKIIGWTLLILVVLFFIWFFKFKYNKGSKKPIDLIKVSSGKK